MTLFYDWRDLRTAIGTTPTDWPMTFGVLAPEITGGVQFVLSKKDPSRETTVGSVKRTGAYDQRARCLAYRNGIYIPAAGRTLPSKRHPIELWPAGSKRIYGTMALKTPNSGETRVQINLDATILATLAPSSSAQNPDTSQGGYIDSYSFDGEFDLDAGGLLTAQLWAGALRDVSGRVSGLLNVEPVDS